MVKIFSVLAFLFLSQTSYGFVENVSHGYVNCMACHISPSGGGLLNDYGRSLSKELMTTWGWENSEKPAFGAIENKDWLKIGGDYRTIQTYLNNSEVKQGKQFEMQRNVELGIKVSKVWFVGTLGSQGGPEGTPQKGDFLSERHFALWDLSDEIKLRAGKFRLNFGIYDPNHTRLNKQPIGFGSNSESYILEFSKFSENDEVFISADLGRIDTPRNRSSEKSFSINYAKYTSDKSKVGGSALIGESEDLRRSLVGLYGVGGLFKRWVLKSEIDYQRSHRSSSPQDSKDLVTMMASFGYQVTKGFEPYFIFEHLQRDLEDSTTQQTEAGLGMQWLPVPHFEIQAEYKKQNQKSIPTIQSDIGWLVFHFYL